MNRNRDSERRHDVRWTHADFELAAALKDATDVPSAPESMYREVPWRRSATVLAGVVVSVVLGIWGFAAYVYPPAERRIPAPHP